MRGSPCLQALCCAGAQGARDVLLKRCCQRACGSSNGSGCGRKAQLDRGGAAARRVCGMRRGQRRHWTAWRHPDGGRDRDRVVVQQAGLVRGSPESASHVNSACNSGSSSAAPRKRAPNFMASRCDQRYGAVCVGERIFQRGSLRGAANAQSAHTKTDTLQKVPSGIPDDSMREMRNHYFGFWAGVPRPCSSSDGFSAECICCNNRVAVHRDRRCDAPPRPSAVVARTLADVRPAAAATVRNTVRAARLPARPTSRRAFVMCPPYKHPPACAAMRRSSYRAMTSDPFPTPPVYAQWHSTPRGHFSLMVTMIASRRTA